MHKAADQNFVHIAITKCGIFFVGNMTLANKERKKAMRIYLITAGCLVDTSVCRWLIKAKSEREAWGKGYDIVTHSPVADSGDMDCVRVTKPETVVKHIESGAKLV